MTAKSFEENLVEKLGPDGLRKIRDARVGIAGAGGLGSNCAACLVRSGFRRLTIVDFDVVEPANLDRQFYFLDQAGMPKVEALKVNLLRIEPKLELETSRSRIDEGNVGALFKDCAAVAECLDRAEYKRILVEDLLKRRIFTVAASGLGGVGGSDAITTRRIMENLIMIGDRVSDICLKPAIAPRVLVSAAKQADAILEFILKK